VTLGACLSIALAQAAFAGEHGCSAADSAEASGHQTSQQDIVDVVEESIYPILDAVRAAGLLDTPQGGECPYAVLAPADEAFARTPNDPLVAVLTYYFVPDGVEVKDLLGLPSAKNLKGQPLGIATEDGVTVEGASVIQTEIEASNGVIYVIDIVILPES
jgi:uncharacterized surface protein with fasciclin (FAS1) repeats